MFDLTKKCYFWYRFPALISSALHIHREEAVKKNQAKRGSSPRPAPTRSELRKARKKAKDLENQLDALENQLDTMELSRDTYKAELETCQRNLEALREKDSQTTSLLKAHEGLGAKFTARIDELEKEVASNTATQKTITELERRLAEISAGGVTLQRLTEKQSLDLEEIPKLQHEALALKNEISAVRRSLEAADHGRREAQEHAHTLEAQLKESHELQKTLISSIQGKATIHIAQGNATIHMSDKMKVAHGAMSPFEDH